MSPGTAPLFAIGLVLCVLVGSTSVVAAVWTARSDYIAARTDGGMPLGNKELIMWRQGADFRIATRPGGPIFVMWAGVPTAAQRASVDEVWGRPNHWLKVPTFSLSLWWPFAMSCVLPSLWLLRHRRQSIRGFDVVPTGPTA